MHSPDTASPDPSEEASEPPIAAAQALLAEGGDLLLVADASGRLTWANARFERLTGLRAADWRGRTLADLCKGSEAGDDARRRMRDGMASGRGFESVDINLPSPGGGALPCRARATPYTDAEGGGFVLALDDIRELRAQTREAKRNAELLAMAGEFGRLGMWEREIPSGEGHWDPQVFRFFDMDPSEGTPNYSVAAQRIDPEDQIDLGYLESIKQAGRHAKRYRVAARDGRVRVIHSQWEIIAGPDGKPARAIGMMVDDTEAYELARSLSQANLQLKMALELGAIAIWRHDLKTGLVHYEEGAWRVLGLQPRAEGLTLDAARSRIHPDDVAIVADSAQTALTTGNPVDYMSRYLHADGSWRHLLTRRVVQRDARGEPLAFIGVALDLTERMADSQRAVELAKRLEATTRAASIGTFSLDLASGKREWNAEMFRLLDLPQADEPPDFDESVRSRVHVDDRERVLRHGYAWRDTRDGAFEIEYRVVHGDGSLHWLSQRSAVDRSAGEGLLFGVSLDVTQRKVAEEALQVANRRVALAARGAGIGIWERDAAGHIGYWDEQMYRLRGLDPAAGQPSIEQLAAITHPDDVPGVRDSLDRGLRTGEPIAHDFRVHLPDGEWRWLASRAFPVRDAAGRIVRLTGVNWDITEARHSELERQERIAAQRESRAKSQFLARMSHELRTPLNAVLGFSRLMLTDGRRLDDEDHRRLEHIRAAGEHLLSLINDVLDLSGIDTGEMKLTLGAVDLSQLVAQTLPLVAPLAQPLRVSIQTGALDETVWADATRLRQVLLNLLSNAIKYNREGGRVEIAARRDGASVRLRVADSGRGMSGEQLQHLYEPFNRLGIEGSGIAGTGIGLAIVKALVERMGGAVSATSTAGVGSVFELRLETAQAPARAAVASPAATQPPAPIPGATPYRGQILYIEDNAVNVMIVEELIARFPGLAMASEVDGERGVRRAALLQPDLILIDMQLPDFDGHEVLRRLRAQPATASIPCIALSANAMPEDIEAALAAGFADYWTKPIDFGAFIDSMKTLFAR